MLTRAYKFRLYPTAAQAATLTAWQAACWEIQRLCVIERRQHRAYVRRCKRRGITPAVKTPTWGSQARLMTELRALYPHLGAVPSSVLRNIVERIHIAQQRAVEKTKQTGKFINIRWANSADHIGMTFRGESEGTHLVGQTAKYGYWKLDRAVASLGILKVRMHRAFPEGTDIRQVHVTRKNDAWFASFVCLIPDLPPAPPAKYPTTGVDIGCIHEGHSQRIAVTDDGRVFHTTDQLKRNARRLAILQTLVSNRRVKGGAKHANPKSKRTAKRRARIARLQERIARQREHVLHYTARRLVDSADTIAFEDLNHQAMRRRGKGKRKSGLNRALSTAAPGRLLALATEKASAIGRTVVKVDARGTSQACSACGVTGERKGLDVRHWTCTACRTRHDRDINAARNIRARAIPNTPAFSGGVPGERRAISDSERGPMNLEATPVARRENAPVPKKIRPKKQVVGVAGHWSQLPLDLFGVTDSG